MNGGKRKIIAVDKMVNLIKAGAFDKLENKPREEIMQDFLGEVSGTKTRLTMQNFNALIDGGFVPEELDDSARFYKFVKYLRTMKYEDYYMLDEVSEDYYFEEGLDTNEIKYVKVKRKVLNLSSKNT